MKRTSSERNNSLPMGVRLTGLQLNEVRKIRLNDFRAPADDQFAKAGWHTDSTKVDLMIRILKFNLGQLAKGLKIEAGDPIPEGAIRIAFGEFAATYRVGEFAKTLSDNVKAVLLARAGCEQGHEVRVVGAGGAAGIAHGGAPVVQRGAFGRFFGGRQIILSRRSEAETDSFV